MPDLWMDVDIALSEVPINILPLIDDTDFKAIEDALTYDQAGLVLVWNFVTTGGAFTQTAVVPTEAGIHDWVNQGNGMYTIEVPGAGGTINNDTEGFGWFTGVATGVLPWRGPTIGFRSASVNDALVDSTSLLQVNANVGVESGTAQSGTTATIVLKAGASGTNDIYKGNVVAITGGQGAGQARVIAKYVGGSKTVTVARAWVTAPNNTSEYIVIPHGSDALLSRGVAQAGSTTTITLEAGEVGTDNHYNGQLVNILSGTGVGQSRIIIKYIASTQVATVDRAWSTAPSSDSVYTITEFGNVMTMHQGVAQDGGDNTVTLALDASAINNAYKDCVVVIAAGTGAEQSRIISGYDGGTKVAAVAEDWMVNPNNTSVYRVLPIGRAVATILRPYGAVVADAGNSSSSFKTDLSEALNTHWNHSFITFVSGDLTNATRRVTGYNGGTKFITVESAFPAAPAADDTFKLIIE